MSAVIYTPNIVQLQRNGSPSIVLDLASVQLGNNRGVSYYRALEVQEPEFWKTERERII
jgi:hypothetical protein